MKYILLQLIKSNTLDGDYSVPAGHIEKDESVIDASIREGLEELNIFIDSKDVEVCQVMHRKTNEVRVDFFVIIKKFSGTISNNEPEKCSELKWSDASHLPLNTIPYVKKAITNYLAEIKFDVYGWS
jgi:ADP-ribose pyrophosphatase YjhB (NUDIX family)